MIKLGGPPTVIIFKGVVVFMIYIGVDIAKQKHFASVMSSEGEILIPPFSFTNDHIGFQLILSKLSAFEKEFLIIGMESTAHYGENLICFLFSRGFRICVINPIQTAALRKTNIRKTKTDSVDTYLIIKALIMNQYRLFTQRDLKP
jgi:transposase